MKSHKKEIITVAILMAAAVVIFAGILKPEATQTKKCSLIYIPKIRDNTNDFWTSVISGCKMAAEEYESDLEILAPDKEENIEEQNKLLKKAIEHVLKLKVIDLKTDPQLMGALGAAEYARQKGMAR